jgi:hypothetical protein
MKRRVWALCFCLIVFFCAARGSFAAADETPPAADSNTISANEIKLKDYLTMLFLQCLDRQRIAEAKTLAAPEDSSEEMTEGLDDAMIDLAEILDEIGDVFKAYYGVENGGQIKRLLEQYINMLQDYADTAKEHNEQYAMIFDMHDKADEIADMFSLLNPGAENNGLADALRKYSDLSVEEIEMKNKTLGEQDPDLYYETSRKSAEIAGIFAAGAARQFPDKFR